MFKDRAEYLKDYYSKNKEKLKADARKYYKKNRVHLLKGKKELTKKYKTDDPNYDRKQALKKRYNLTLEQYYELHGRQNGTCAICKKPQNVKNKVLCVDHDHTTGKVRGLLCDKHNWAIGLFGDSIEDLKAAIAYLELNHVS